ncbi:MAG TPA: hypothetical protein VGR20_19600 [Acidimicrobiia bacterium]|nr:hypothetical protein [Acidimicrobiia bacterium]
MDKVVIIDPAAAQALVGESLAVVVAAPDPVAVADAVATLREGGMEAAGWIGHPSDPAAQEMALELFPGCEVVVRR